MIDVDKPKIGRKEAAFLALLVVLACVFYGAFYFSDYKYLSARRNMARRCVSEKAPLSLYRALAKVPRHRFVHSIDLERAYVDIPLRAPNGRAITQPSILAYMIEQVTLTPKDKVLAVDASSGYEVAVLAEQCASVFALAFSEKERDDCESLLMNLGYDNVTVKYGDGRAGLPEYGPYDVIFARCAVKEIPEELVSQLNMGGRLIVSVDLVNVRQFLTLCQKISNEQVVSYPLMPAVFLPMDETYFETGVIGQEGRLPR